VVGYCNKSRVLATATEPVARPLLGNLPSTPTAIFVAETLAPMCRGKDRDELLWSHAKGSSLSPASKNSPFGCVKGVPRRLPHFRGSRRDLQHTYDSSNISSGANVLVVQRASRSREC
jgi:hypothetical protein